MAILELLVGLKGEGIDEAELRSGLRKRQIVKSRRIFCQIVVKEMGYSGADVARFLGVNTSAVNRLAASDELPEVDKYVYIILEPTSPFTQSDQHYLRNNMFSSLSFQIIVPWI